MRPLFAIAPLALALSLLGPSSQASPNEPSWIGALLSWVSDRQNDEASQAPSSAASQASFMSTVNASR